MLRRIDTLYKERPTLSELYEDDAQLFSGLSASLPTNVSPPTYGLSEFVSLALVELGELQTIFPDAAKLKAFLSTWGKLHAANWARMQDALNTAYNPIHNYDRTESESETVQSTGSSTTASRTAEGGSENTQDYIAGFNSSGQVSANPTTRSNSQPGKTLDGTGSATDNSTVGRQRALSVSGNIGVTTNQQMVTAELQMRDEYALYYMILDEFRREICVEVW